MAILHLKQSTRLMNMLIQEVHNFFSPISAVKIRVWKRPSETYMLLDHHLERHHLPDLPRSYLPHRIPVVWCPTLMWPLMWDQNVRVWLLDVFWHIGLSGSPTVWGLGNLSQPSCWLTVFKRGRMLGCSGGLPFHKDIQSFLELPDHCKFL